MNFDKSKEIAGWVTVLNLPEKYIIPTSKNISIIVSYSLWTLGRIGFIFHKLNFHANFAYITTVKPRTSEKNISKKVWLRFTAIVLPTL